MRKNETREFLIEDIEFPAVGVAFYNDKKVYIKGAVPGQKVLARVSKVRREKIEAKLKEIVTNIPGAAQPKCPDFGVCGGCVHQFLPYEKQLEFKEREVLKLFKDAKIEGFEYLGILGSPEKEEYRNKMEYTFGDFVKGGELTLGMHAKNSGFSIVNTDKCNIVDEDFRIILKTVVEYFRKKDLPIYKVMQHVGYLRNLVVRKAKNTGEILIALVTTSQVDFDLTELTEILKSINYLGELKGILHVINDGLADMVRGDKIVTLFGQDYITERILDLKFKISLFSFFQTNSKGAEKLYSEVLEFLGDVSNKTVFDLYCGTGTIGQLASKKAEKVIGIELIEEAVEAAKENTKLNNISNCSFIAGDVAKVITEIKEKPDTIILDPPRPGVSPNAMKYVIKFNAPEIVYVSCNPKTLVNDLGVLRAYGYEVEKVKIVDMFPGTGHVETVVLLQRKII
ncbi:tRNA (uracil-5-)-methyltransferase [Clostridium acetobutylicum]|nr:S-adenosylmethionine-dependent methyltransferase [Clostridium acetobutylicum EA 2018]NOV90261.1 tRNA (uracil-5-)-methyltransferase [Clostridium acetobutylicum]NOW15212.1 tRNA (uracil-5-)-methyltransferase [Clostridium acetobutylicum]NRY56891.1 tRNA (uracil-5-)-methyltransferase [Clostridium acetobutylicum]NSA93637.1 tRNA (uracil-5-)-methyltransferase [Clostridium acetobutylicum]